MKKRALISVSDKRNILSLAKALVEHGYDILSTGGTAKAIREAGINVIDVDDVTKFPEILDGRVKTLHPKIHGGLLAKNTAAHEEQLKEHKIHRIDMLVVNLYPFQETLAKEEASAEEIIENIDIGGPAMLRASAKNYESVSVVVDPADYELVLKELEENEGEISLETRKAFAAKVFRHTAQYDALIAQYFLEETKEVFPKQYTVTYEKVQELRYGENPHQEAAFYKELHAAQTSIAEAKQLHGKELSYNNIQDANAALEIVTEYEEAAAVAVKHMNPCGIGVGKTLEEAFKRAYDADPVSIFGGIVAVNREVTKDLAEKLHDIFLEIVLAPKFTEEALEILTKKKNIRLLEMKVKKPEEEEMKLTSVHGGLLLQSRDEYEVTEEDFEIVTEREPSQDEIQDLIFAQKAVKHVKSNAIVLAKAGQTIGIGAGQMNRVGAAKIAIEQAGEKAKGSVLASDAFFPMPDTVEAAVAAGVTAIVQPGGSKRDEDSIKVCNDHGIAMVFTKIRHFKH